MIILTIIASFLIFSVTLLFGIAIGYSLGYKAEHSLKKQVNRLKEKVRKNNESEALRELTAKEVKARDDYDFREKLARITGNNPTDVNRDNVYDPDSTENTF